jgi:hypothetical protein
MPSDLRHIVNTQDAGFIDCWIEVAAFRWFTDAKHYAIRASKTDRLGRVFVIENDGTRPTYFQRGHEIDDLADAA